VRIADYGDRVPVEERDRLAVHLVGARAVELEVARGRDDVGAPLADRLARVLRLERSEFVDTGRDGVAKLHQEASALRGGELAPGALEGGAGGLHRVVDLGRARARDGGERPAIGGAEDLDGAAVVGTAALAPDEVEIEALRRLRRVPVGCVHGEALVSVSGGAGEPAPASA
jgi:hypothetical protein